MGKRVFDCFVIEGIYDHMLRGKTYMLSKTSANEPKTENCGPGRCYFVTLHTIGRKGLLAYAETAESELVGLVPSRIGLLCKAAWNDLSKIHTELLCLTPNRLEAVVSIFGPSRSCVQTADPLRVLHEVVNGFKIETTRLYNTASMQDYRSRLWSPAFECELIQTPARLAELRAYFSEEATLRRVQMLF